MALRGVSGEQDGRFADKDARERRRVRLPAEVEAGGPVDLRRVNLGALRPWVAAQLRERLGFEDDIVEGFVLGQLEGASADPRAVTVSLKPFLGDEHAAPFVVELWRLLLSAQESPGGIPRQFVEEEAARAREARKEAERLEQEMARARRRFEEGSRERAAAFRPGPGEGRRPSRWEQPQGVGRGRHQTVPAWMEEPGDPGGGRGALGGPPPRAFGGGGGGGGGVAAAAAAAAPAAPGPRAPVAAAAAAAALAAGSPVAPVAAAAAAPAGGGSGARLRGCGGEERALIRSRRPGRGAGGSSVAAQGRRAKGAGGSTTVTPAAGIGTERKTTTGGAEPRPPLYLEGEGWGRGSLRPRNEELCACCVKFNHVCGEPVIYSLGMRRRATRFRRSSRPAGRRR